MNNTEQRQSVRGWPQAARRPLGCSASKSQPCCRASWRLQPPCLFCTEWHVIQANWLLYLTWRAFRMVWGYSLAYLMWWRFVILKLLFLTTQWVDICSLRCKGPSDTDRAYSLASREERRNQIITVLGSVPKTFVEEVSTLVIPQRVRWFGLFLEVS